MQRPVAKSLLDAVLDDPVLTKKAHPRSEHLMPLFVIAGALEDNESLLVLHNEFAYGTLGMGCYGSVC